MVRKEKMEVRHEMRGGKGDVYLYHVLEEDEMLGYGRLYARVVLPPGSSIGVHEHAKDTEPFYILKGTGLFTDTDGSVVRVNPGDVCLIGFGNSHGIENDGDEDLELMALILFKPDETEGS